MADENQWAFDLETKIYSIVKSRLTSKLTKYPNAMITNKGTSTTTAMFPTIYIHELPGAERGQDLSGQNINAISETFQVDVTTNVSQSDAKKVMSLVAMEFKKLRFTITTFPDLSSSDDVYRSTMRCTRIIGANDIL